MGFGFKHKQKGVLPDVDKKTSGRRKVECYKLSTKYLYRRAFSEIQLLDSTSKLEEGYSYNYITAGDVDALSFLKIVLRLQDLDYLLFSTGA